MDFYTYTLPNGIRGIHRQVRSKVAHCALAVNAGSRDELPSEHGLAHFTEHGFFKGTTHRKAFQVNCRLENLGGELNAYTTKEDTIIHATFLRSDFSKAVELIADVAFNSTFPDKELAKERDVIIDEINTYKDAPTEMLFDTFEDMIFEGSDLGHNILGRKSSLARFDSESIKEFRRRTHTTDQMVFSSTGNFSPAVAEQVARRYLAEQEASVRGYDRVAPPTHTPFFKSVAKHTHQTHCIVGNRAYGILNPKRLALSLLINILGGPCANSRLNVLLREKRGLSYNIGAYYTPYCDSGIVFIYFSCDTDKTDLCLELIDNELRSLQTEPLSARRLSMAKKQFIAQLAITLDANEGCMLGLGKSLLVRDNLDTFEESCRKINAIKAEDIMEVATEIFSNNSTLMYR